MRRFTFDSPEAFEAALRTVSIPAESLAAPVSTGVDAGRIWVEGALPVGVCNRLEELGVRVSPARGSGRVVNRWMEVLPCTRVAEPEDVPRVLFLVDRNTMLALAGELLRLGCDRQRWSMLADDEVLLEAADPPWYTVLSALDSDARRVFVPCSPGVWIRLAHHHVFAEGMQPANGELLLVDEVWRTVSPGPWEDLYERLTVPLPAVCAHVPVPEPPRIQVDLRLVTGVRAGVPTLWVLRQDGVALVENLLAHLVDDLASQLLFAVSGELVVLRARPGGEIPVLDLDADAYGTLADVPHLFAPLNATLEPPLRRGTLQQLLAPDPRHLTWITSNPEGGIALERLEESGFRPLTDWVDYIIARDEPVLRGWVEAATFAFDPWIDLRREWSEPAQRPAAVPRAKEEVVPEATPTVVVAEPVATRVSRPPTALAAAPDERTAMQAALQDTRHRFRQLESPADDPVRLALWMEMAAFHHMLDQGREATLCAVQAVWEDGSLASTWADFELGALELDPEGLRQAVLAQPTAARLRALGACFVAGRLPPDDTLGPLFNRLSDQVDVRTAWLARERIAGDDELALARARDDLLARLRAGLVLDRDVPGVIRTLEQDHLTRVVAHLHAQRAHFRDTPRDRNILEAPDALTQPYVDLVFAWGFAAIGESDVARTLLASADQLDRTDPIHRVLTALYTARIEQILAGSPRGTPLPPATATGLQELDKFSRYKVDRLRAASAILEPQERLEPFTAYYSGFEDPRGPEFADLRGLDDPNVLAPRLQVLVEQVQRAPRPLTKENHATSVRLIDGVLDFLPLLPISDALPLLDAITEQLTVLEPTSRVQLLNDALMAAGLFGLLDRAVALVGRLGDALGDLDHEALPGVADSLAQSLRSLGRVGLQREAAHLLETLSARLTEAPDPVAVRLARVAVAGGQLALGLPEALASLDPLLEALHEEQFLSKRLLLTQALALALSQAPREEALARLPELSAHLPVVTDQFSTNTHFGFSMVVYAEATVIGATDIDVGSRARSWMDAAEFAIRQRLHAR